MKKNNSFRRKLVRREGPKAEDIVEEYHQNLKRKVDEDLEEIRRMQNEMVERAEYLKAIMAAEGILGG